MTAKPISLSQPRPAQPRRWSNLAFAGAAITLAAAPALGQELSSKLGIAKDMGAVLWTAQAEGGEGGEAGAVAEAPTDVAYLAQLSIVEGHLVAARDLYRKGMVDEAVGLSYHPEAEMMDDVRAALGAHNVPDITPAMTAFSQAMEKDAPLPEIDAALAAAQAAIATAAGPETDELRTRFDAIALVLGAAASEYAGSIEGGSVSDVMAYHESHAFIAVARNLATGLAAIPATKAAADKALAALDSTDEAYGDMSSTTLEARDPAILLAVAARVELIASSVR